MDFGQVMEVGMYSEMNQHIVEFVFYFEKITEY